MIDIILAILPKSFEELERELARLKGIAPFIQIDLVGENVLIGKEELPLWQEFDFECDIMLPDPAAAVQTCIDIGASRVVVHAAASTARQALEALQKLRAMTKPTFQSAPRPERRGYPISVGVALRSHDTPEELKKFEGLYDYVQVMGIERVGFQGQPFDERALGFVRQLRTSYPELVIQVDGGVAPHVKELAEAGASRLVIGSAIVRAQNPREVYRALYTEANAR